MRQYKNVAGYLNDFFLLKFFFKFSNFQIGLWYVRVCACTKIAQKKNSLEAL